MSDWINYAIPASIIIPLYSWTSLLFSIPLFFIEPVVFIVLLINGGSFSDNSNSYYYYLWALLIGWFGIPFFDFLAIFAEIILIPTFIVAVTIAAVGLFSIYVFLYYVIPTKGYNYN